MRFSPRTPGNPGRRAPAFWHPKRGTSRPMSAVWLTWPRLPHGLPALILFACAGCSEGGTAAFSPGPAALSESELAAIKDSAKTGRDFNQSLKAKMLEKAGVAVSKKPDGKGIKRKAR